MNPWWILLALAVVLVWKICHAARGLQDDLEHIWNLPAYDPNSDAGCERPRQAIRDDGEEEEL